MSIPLASLTPELEQERFYAAIGKAITQWQHVEGRLGLIFAEAMGLGGSLAGNMAFYSVISFDAKLSMTNAALNGTAYSPECMALWPALLNKMGRRNKRRNTLAHFMLDFDQNGKPGYRYHLRPNVFDANAARRWGNKPPRLNLCQVTATGNAFEKLAAELVNFWRLMARERWRVTQIAEFRASEPHLERLEPQKPSDPTDTESEGPPEPSQV